ATLAWARATRATAFVRARVRSVVALPPAGREDGRNDVTRQHWTEEHHRILIRIPRRFAATAPARNSTKEVRSVLTPPGVALHHLRQLTDRLRLHPPAKLSEIHAFAEVKGNHARPEEIVRIVLETNL